MASCISNAVSDFCRWNYYFPLSNRIRMVIIRIGIYWYLIQVSWGVPLGARRNGCVRWSIERYKGTLKAASWRWQSSDAKHGKVNPLLSQAPSSARRPREEGALGIGLATAASLCLSQLLAWRERPCSPEWGCHKQWEPLGTFWHTAWLCMASPISQAFPASSHISGNFLIERIGRQPHFSASYSCLLCITAITLKKKNSGLYGRTEQFKT